MAPVLCLVLAVCLAWPLPVQARMELAAADRITFDNGLVLIILEEHSFPSASVQMLYRAGARDEQYGTTGVAHFLEHMAFRATENFPDTEVVSRIYAVGGEWHGYTWIDQTTYYSTVPSDQVDLLLRIEADRMHRLLIEPSMVEPERGAVLAEMQGYENDPASVLHDGLVFTALQAHPYRNNTIGWESDIRAMQHADLVAFYQAHYRPSNAVLAVVGNVDAAAVTQRVTELFGHLPAAPATPLPRTVEPRQQGERRIILQGAGGRSYFEIAYQAPGVNHPDFPAFLLVQELLIGGTGVNFQQVFGTSPGQSGRMLSGVAEDIRSWFPPSAQNYLFSVAGTVEASTLPADIEDAVEVPVARLRDHPLAPEMLDAARQKVLEALIFDVETHEDAAHQMAFFDGLQAWELLHLLPTRVAAVNPDDVRRVARQWLQPYQRTLGWYLAGDPPAAPPPAPGSAAAGQAADPEVPGLPQAARPPDPGGAQAYAQIDATASAEATVPANLAASGAAADSSAGVRAGSKPAGAGRAVPEHQSRVHHLPGGLVLVLQDNPASPGVHLRLVLNGDTFDGDSAWQRHQPLWGLSSLEAKTLTAGLEPALAGLRRSFDALRLPDEPAGQLQPLPADPLDRLEAGYAELLGLGQRLLPAQPAATLLTVVGNFDETEVIHWVGQHFADVPTEPAPPQAPLVVERDDLRLAAPAAAAQAQIGYAVPAPLPSSDQFMAWQALLYIVSHGYEGRLGKAAISERGLAYYVDGQYRSDGQQAWIALTTGVDPLKLDRLESLYRAQLAGLRSDPPTRAEVAEAQRHFAGRLASARQSNEEIAQGLAMQWLWHGQILTPRQALQQTQALNYEDVLAAVEGFAGGRIVTVGAGNQLSESTRSE